MDTHSFTLNLVGLSGDVSAALTDAIYDSGCDDALLGGQADGVVYLDFDRKATSMEEAIASAIRDLASVGIRGLLVDNNED